MHTTDGDTTNIAHHWPAHRGTGVNATFMPQKPDAKQCRAWATSR